MPLNDKGRKILSAMEKEYGSKVGKRVFYASRNKGRIKGVDRTEDFSLPMASSNLLGKPMPGEKYTLHNGGFPVTDMRSVVARATDASFLRRSDGSMMPPFGGEKIKEPHTPTVEGPGSKGIKEANQFAQPFRSGRKLIGEDARSVLLDSLSVKAFTEDPTKDDDVAAAVARHSALAKKHTAAYHDTSHRGHMRAARTHIEAAALLTAGKKRNYNKVAKTANAASKALGYTKDLTDLRRSLAMRTAVKRPRPSSMKESSLTPAMRTDAAASEHDAEFVKHMRTSNKRTTAPLHELEAAHDYMKKHSPSESSQRPGVMSFHRMQAKALAAEIRKRKTTTDAVDRFDLHDKAKRSASRYLKLATEHANAGNEEAAASFLHAHNRASQAAQAHMQGKHDVADKHLGIARAMAYHWKRKAPIHPVSGTSTTLTGSQPKKITKDASSDATRQAAEHHAGVATRWSNAAREHQAAGRTTHALLLGKASEFASGAAKAFKRGDIQAGNNYSRRAYAYYNRTSPATQDGEIDHKENFSKYRNLAHHYTEHGNAKAASAYRQAAFHSGKAHLAENPNDNREHATRAAYHATLALRHARGATTQDVEERFPKQHPRAGKVSNKMKAPKTLGYASQSKHFGQQPNATAKPGPNMEKGLIRPAPVTASPGPSDKKRKLHMEHVRVATDPSKRTTEMLQRSNGHFTRIIDDPKSHPDWRKAAVKHRERVRKELLSRPDSAFGSHDEAGKIKEIVSRRLGEYAKEGIEA